MTVQPLHKATPTRPPPTHFKYVALNWFRESLSLPTWLALGAALQAILFILPIRRYLAIAPAFIYLLLTIVDEALGTFGFKQNKYMARITPGKYTAVLPHDKGGFNQDQPRHDKICILLLGISINHSLGPLAPGYTSLQAHFLKMQTHLESNPRPTGYLGSSFFTESGAHHTKSGSMIVYYFRSLSDVHSFAAGPQHRAGWDWFARNSKTYPHLGIWHEVYEAPAGKWESVYYNQKAVGLGKTMHAFEDEGAREMWTSPAVRAMGSLRSTFGRLGVQGESAMETF